AGFGVAPGDLRRPARLRGGRSGAFHPAGGTRGPLRTARARQPSPPRLPVMRADGRRRLRRRRVTVSDSERLPRLRHRRGRGHVLGPVSRVPQEAAGRIGTPAHRVRRLTRSLPTVSAAARRGGSRRTWPHPPTTAPPPPPIPAPPSKATNIRSPWAQAGRSCCRTPT